METLHPPMDCSGGGGVVVLVQRPEPNTYPVSQMLVKQKEANRQSMILMQGAEPGAQLLRALDEVAKLTRELEEAKLEHQAKVSTSRFRHKRQMRNWGRATALKVDHGHSNGS